MKIRILIFCLILTFSSLRGQLTHIEVGVTGTQYVYSNEQGDRLSDLIPQNGIKAAVKFKTKLDNFFIGMLYHELNAKGGSMAQIYEWETAYAGLNLHYNFPLQKRIQVGLGIGFMHLIKGDQFIDGQHRSLSSNAEFNGVWLNPSIELGYKLKQISSGDFNLKYSIYPATKIGSQGSEKLFFISHHFGLEFKFAPPEKEK